MKPAALCLGLLFAAVLRAEDGYELWLRYRAEPDPARRAAYGALVARIDFPAGTPVRDAARAELARALPALTGGSFAWDDTARATLRFVRDPALESPPAALGREGFRLRAEGDGPAPHLVVSGATDLALLRATFHLLRQLQLGTAPAALAGDEPERVRARLAHHWDNPVRSTAFRNETIERGYAGDSFFRWDELPGRVDPRLHDWARLLAAMGMNGVMVNNVNTAKKGLEGWRLLTPEYLPRLAAMAGVLRPYGVRLYVSVNFFSPVLIDRLGTADPLAPEVRAWWQRKADAIYAAIPDFGGFLVKADSEGEPGPMKFGRTHADGANMIAAALAPHGGEVHWRAFVYDRTLGDRVTQAFTNFMPLDGQFAANVRLQIKNGPLDFQVREPVSPLFGGLRRTNQLIELQITQEYTGQDKHVCYLGAQWEEILRFDTHSRGPGSTVARLLTDRLNPGTRNGIVGVMNTGDSRNWTGHHLAQANTYALGRLAWNPELPAARIADEWIQLTFGRDPEVRRVLGRILADSWRTYEDYTAPIGLGHLTRRGDHFYPDPENRVDYHGGNARGLGTDRSVRTGTGFAGQFAEPWRSRFEDPATTPEDLLLFFHHLPYTHRLHHGRTVIQEIYDRHFAGVERVRGFVAAWDTLRGRIDDERFAHIRARLVAQVGHAEQWCRSINGYFQQLSGIPDAHARPLPFAAPLPPR